MLLFNLFFWTFIYKGTRYLSEKSKGLLKDWSTEEDSRILSFYAVSTVHSTIMSIFPLYYYFNGDEYGLIREFGENENILLNLSLSYFIWDFYYVYLYKSLPFFIHHTMGISFLLIFKTQPLAGVFLISIFLPEVTTPLLNVWQLSKMKKYKIFDKINTFFTFSYIFVRVGLISIFNIYCFNKLLNSDKLNNKIVYSLLGISIIYTFGNFSWSWKLFQGFKKWYLRKD